MRKTFALFSIMLALAVAFSPPAAHAQTATRANRETVLTPTKTSLTNVDTADATFAAPVGFPVKYLVAAVTLTKGSGTLAGTIVLEGATSASGDYGLIGANSYTITDIAKKVKVFSVSSPEANFPYYRIRVLPTGTQTSTVGRVSVIFR